MSKKNLFKSAAVLLVLLVLIPSLHSVDAQEDRLAKIESRMASRLKAAAPGEYVTAVVRFHGTPDRRLFGGSRQSYVSELRNVAGRSQRAAGTYLARPSLKSKIKKTKGFWLDNIMLI
ncbi:MAG: hypothetical protein KAU31_17530, partial [Spirochaetaceae bacterium]|nr:hypothetical protein [Spirochaetaceae bacterium]